MPSLLFICTGNRVRSPVAAAYFSELIKSKDDLDSWSIDSAGTWTQEGLPAEPAARSIGQRYGLNLDGHLTKQVKGEMLSKFDMVLVMEASHKEALEYEFAEVAGKVFLLSEMIGKRFDIFDPFLNEEEGTVLEEEIREICNIIERGFDRICELARTLAVQSS